MQLKRKLAANKKRPLKFLYQNEKKVEEKKLCQHHKCEKIIVLVLIPIVTDRGSFQFGYYYFIGCNFIFMVAANVMAYRHASLG